MKTRLLCCSLGQRRGWSPHKGYLSLQGAWHRLVGLVGTARWGWAVFAGAQEEQAGWQKLRCFQPACVSRPQQVQVLKSKLARKVIFA